MLVYIIYLVLTREFQLSYQNQLCFNYLVRSRYFVCICIGIYCMYLLIVLLEECNSKTNGKILIHRC